MRGQNGFFSFSTKIRIIRMLFALNQSLLRSDGTPHQSFAIAQDGAGQAGQGLENTSRNLLLAPRAPYFRRRRIVLGYSNPEDL